MVKNIDKYSNLSEKSEQDNQFHDQFEFTSEDEDYQDMEYDTHQNKTNSSSFDNIFEYEDQIIDKLTI